MLTTELTIPVDLNYAAVGYVVNAALSRTSQQHIATVQGKLSTQFPDAIWVVPSDALHITLLDLLIPVVTYALDKDTLFGEREAAYTVALGQVLQGQRRIPITFDTIEVHPSAVIIKGHDDGSYARIRQELLAILHLEPETKLPPMIIHSTIAKYSKQIPLDSVRSLLAGEHIRFVDTTHQFRVVRETKLFMQAYQVVHSYGLPK